MKHPKYNVKVDLAERLGLKRLANMKNCAVFALNGSSYKLYIGKTGQLRVGRSVSASYTYPHDTLDRAARAD